MSVSTQHPEQVNHHGPSAEPWLWGVGRDCSRAGASFRGVESVLKSMATVANSANSLKTTQLYVLKGVKVPHDPAIAPLGVRPKDTVI